jgi:hypothetical protein
MAKEAGIILVDDKVVATTRQCCHCGNHFIMVKGSGRLRGWCMKCHGITCGNIECCPCIPFEKKLEEVEAGKRTHLI